MATSVVVLCANAKRLNIKVTPNTSILQILEQACKKQNLDPHQYDLIHQRKVVDLSLTVRFANLSNNALLELCPSLKDRKESKVTVCLQTEGGARLVHDFNPTSTLWDILVHWIQQIGENTLRGDVSESAEPILLYMRKEVVGEKGLKETTLRDLGLTGGNAVIRLFYRVPTLLKTQAHVESLQLRPKLEDNSQDVHIEVKEQQPSSEVNSNTKELLVVTNVETMDVDEQDSSKGILQESFVPTEPLSAEIQNTVQPVEDTRHSSNWNNKNLANPDNFHVPSEPPPAENQNTVKPVEDTSQSSSLNNKNPEIIYVGDHDAVLYDAKNISPSHVQENLPDDFFEITVEDARYLYSTLKKQREELENQTLCTQSYKASMKIERMLRFKNTILRILFPDQLVLQARFSTLDNVSSVMEFIRKFLEDSKMDFHLFTTPPKTILRPEQALYEADLVPASVVHVGCTHSSKTVLKPEVLSKISSHAAACQAAALIRNSFNLNNAKEIEIPTASQEKATPVQETISASISNSHFQDEERGSQVTAPTSTKVPRWFRTGQK